MKEEINKYLENRSQIYDYDENEVNGLNFNKTEDLTQENIDNLLFLDQQNKSNDQFKKKENEEKNNRIKLLNEKIKQFENFIEEE